MFIFHSHFQFATFCFISFLDWISVGILPLPRPNQFFHLPCPGPRRLTCVSVSLEQHCCLAGGVGGHESNPMAFPACTAAPAFPALSHCTHSSLLPSQGGDGFTWCAHFLLVCLTPRTPLYVGRPLRSGDPVNSTVCKCPVGIGKEEIFCLLDIV